MPHRAVPLSIRVGVTLAVCFLLSPTAFVSGEDYPVGALQCMSTLTLPEEQLICPKGRDSFCEKNELPNIPASKCGKGEYFGFKYDEKIKRCAWRRCAAACEERMGTTQIEVDGEEYNWDRYCCNDEDFCNTSSVLKTGLLWVVLCVISALFVWSGSDIAPFRAHA